MFIKTEAKLCDIWKWIQKYASKKWIEECKEQREVCRNECYKRRISNDVGLVILNSTLAIEQKKERK